MAGAIRQDLGQAALAQMLRTDAYYALGNSRSAVLLYQTTHGPHETVNLTGSRSCSNTARNPTRESGTNQPGRV